MREEGVISTGQYIWMLFVLIASVTNFLAPEFLIGIAGRDAWLSALGGWFLDAMLAIIYGYMGLRFAGQNFVQYSVTILGGFLGRIVGLMFPFFFLLVCTVLMSGLAHLINTMFLPKTPLFVILGAGLLLIAYAAGQGVEVNGRVAGLIGPVYLLSIIVLIFLVIPYMDISRLKPQFDQGIAPFLLGSPFILSFYAICIMMAMLIPLCNRPEDGFLGKFTAVSLGASVIGSIVAIGVATLGYQQARDKLNPGLTLSSLVIIGRFWERVEIIWMTIAVASGIIAAAMLLWSFCLGFSQVMGLRSYRPLVYPAALVCFATGLSSFGNYIALADFVHYTFPILAIFVEGILEIMLFVLALLLRKRCQTL